ncbi:hypothetical protein JCM17846_18300 [Iodidimonas nitroreducens]|uniref:Peptidase S24/S26A/S26B/S26C domain-containing protein n=2 Tax=Iodidimonas TaxID=2066486 RepID=A0A5A7N1G8_9PROT|nr:MULTISPECIES: XRE family transcriptional regulator [Iodidimonas]GAK33272.1 LexA repressor [alpha proteobacterium Q-1]GER00906.1 hypothetical protein JCM17845_15290 [Iodidimonas gelatinilytica]GER04148.1 hypothetical protein JCM17846_18300 [Iodidimonas nitroreducens]
MDIIKQIRAAKRDQNLTDQQIGDMVGLPRYTITKILNGRRRVLAEEADEFVKKLGLISQGQASDPSPIRRIPIAGAIAAGNWREALEDPQGHMYCDVGGPNTFGLRVAGDSMDMVVEDGGYIAVDPDDTDLITGRIYAVMNGSSETTFKKYREDPARLEPLSSNPRHKPIRIGSEDFRIIGRVIWRASLL